MEGLDSPCSDPVCGVEMDADKDGVRLGIGNSHAPSKRDENIRGAGQHGVEPCCLQMFLKAQGNIKGDTFLENDVGADAAQVVAAVPGIDDDC